MNVLAICGSLRNGSTNEALLHAAAQLAPYGMTFDIFTELDRLPHFNPDLDFDGAAPPAPVVALRARVAASHGLIISSPEYAHGVPGALKNALDWLVSTTLDRKPVLLLVAAPGGGAHAMAALAETLRTMDAQVLLDASLNLPGVRKQLDATGRVTDPALAQALAASMEALAAATG